MGHVGAFCRRADTVRIFVSADHDASRCDFLLLYGDLCGDPRQGVVSRKAARDMVARDDWHSAFRHVELLLSFYADDLGLHVGGADVYGARVCNDLLRPFLGERFSRLKLVSVLAMFAGCCLVSGIVGDLHLDLVGILFGLLSGISYGAYNILTKIAMRKGLAPETTTFYSFVTMAVIALSVSRPHEAAALIGKQPLILIPLVLALGLVTYVLPYLLYTKAMRTLPAGTASALGIVEPMSATVFSIAFLDERLSVISVAGIILILLAVFLLGKAEGKE